MKLLVISLIVAALLLSGCASNNSNTNLNGNSVLAGSEKSVEIKGSDTLLQMVSNLAEAYSKKKPEVKISVTGGGSGTGIAALLNGEIPIANSSRPIEVEELEKAKEIGLTPLEIIVGRDTLSVIVHPDNPVKQLSIEQISKIYQGETTNWKGVGGPDKEITLYGRQSTSGTYVYFQENVVKGDYSPKMRNMEGNQAITDAVKQDKTGIGYVGVGYVIDEHGQPVFGLTILSIAKTNGEEFISPIDGSKQSEYPISRELFQYFANPPQKNSPVYDFLMFELSEEGQAIVEQTGFFHITSTDNQKNQEQLKRI